MPIQLFRWYCALRERAELQCLAEMLNSARFDDLSGRFDYTSGTSEYVNRIEAVRKVFDYWEGAPRDYADGARWIRRAAEAGEFVGLGFLAGAISAGDDFKKGLRKAAEQGCVDAQVILGEVCLCEQFGDNQWRLLRKGSRYMEALMWFGVAALRGDAEAQLCLGSIYAKDPGYGAKGTGISKNLVEAAHWYRKSAEQGNVRAQMKLAATNAESCVRTRARPSTRRCSSGEVVSRSCRARRRPLTAQSLGQLRCTFAGPAQRTCRITTGERFNQLLQRRAQVRVQFAQPLAAPACSALPSRRRRWRTLRLRSAQFLQACAHRAARDAGRLEQPFDPATTDGTSFGRRPSTPASFVHKLGCMYAEGKGVLTNEVEAMKWYRIAAGQDDAWAQRALGHAYEYGLGVPQDLAQAVEWYQKAAEERIGRPGGGLGKDDLERLKQPSSRASSEGR